MHTDETISIKNQVHVIPLSRQNLLKKTYTHLLFAIFGFVLLETIYFQTDLASLIAKTLLSLPWMIVLGIYVLLSWMATRFITTKHSLKIQYAGMFTYVFLESIIFVPMLFIATHFTKEPIIQSAAFYTIIGFLSLTAYVFFTKKDFSFLRGLLFWGGILALLAIVGGAIFGFHLGTFFNVLMIGLAGGAILYDTSNILHHYEEDDYVIASIQLFASVALMFWYVLRFLLDSRK